MARRPPHSRAVRLQFDGSQPEQQPIGLQTGLTSKRHLQCTTSPLSSRCYSSSIQRFPTRGALHTAQPPHPAPVPRCPDSSNGLPDVARHIQRLEICNCRPDQGLTPTASCPPVPRSAYLLGGQRTNRQKQRVRFVGWRKLQQAYRCVLWPLTSLLLHLGLA